MKLLGKSRTVSRDKWWRLDCDYLDKLSESERLFMEKFVLEYQLGDKSMPSIHTAVEHMKESRIRRMIAERDVVTASADAIARALKAPVDGNPRKRSSYSPADYSQDVASPEDALIEAIDEEAKA